MLEVFLSYVFDSSVLEIVYKKDVDMNNMFRNLLGDRFTRVNNELIDKMWDKIDTNEFTSIVLTKNYTLYSTANWSRKNDTI